MSAQKMKFVKIGSDLQNEDKQEDFVTPLKQAVSKNSGRLSIETPEKVAVGGLAGNLGNKRIKESGAGEKIMRVLMTYVKIKENMRLLKIYLGIWAAGNTAKYVWEYEDESLGVNIIAHSKKSSVYVEEKVEKKDQASQAGYLDSYFSTHPGHMKRMRSVFLTAALRRFLKLQEKFLAFKSMLKDVNKKEKQVKIECKCINPVKVLAVRHAAYIFKGNLLKTFHLVRSRMVVGGCKNYKRKRFISILTNIRNIILKRLFENIFVDKYKWDTTMYKQAIDSVYKWQRISERLASGKKAKGGSYVIRIMMKLATKNLAKSFCILKKHNQIPINTLVNIAEIALNLQFLIKRLIFKEAFNAIRQSSVRITPTSPPIKNPQKLVCNYWILLPILFIIYLLLHYSIKNYASLS